MGKKSKRRQNARIKRDAAAVGDKGVDLTSPEEADTVGWLKWERRFITQGTLLRKPRTIGEEGGLYYNIARAHLKNPAGRNDSRAEFYFRKVIDMANTDRIGFSDQSVRESFTRLFRLYFESEKSIEASKLLKNFLSKGCDRGSFNRADSIERQVLCHCSVTIVNSQLSTTDMAPLVPVLEKYIETMDKIGHESSCHLSLAMHQYFFGIAFYSKALIYAKKMLHLVQTWSTRYGKLEFRALTELAETCRLLGMYEDALSHLKLADQITTVHLRKAEERKTSPLFGPIEKSRVYELLGDTLKQQAEDRKMKESRERLHEESISYYTKSFDLLKDFLQFGANSTVYTDIDILAPAIQASMRLGHQLANNKKWSQAKEYYMRGVELVQRDENNLKMFMPMIYEELGKVFLDQYLDSDYHYLEEEAKLLLRKAEEYTQKGLVALKYNPNLVTDDTLYFDAAVEIYFLGKKEEACKMLAIHLNARTKVKKCAGCGHTWIKGANVVKKICTKCDAACYCNDICQQLNWKSANDKRLSHKRLCPLLAELKGSFKMTESLQGKILNFFEDLKPSKRREADVTSIDSID